MRALLSLLIIVVIVVIAGIATGFLDINQIRGGRAPRISATGNGIVAKGGQAPAFDVETGSVKVGATQKTVKVPTVAIQRPDQNQAGASTNEQM